MDTQRLDAVAVVLTTYNEDVLLPIWLQYYGTQIGYENLYILDDGSTDGSTNNLGSVQVIRMQREPIDQVKRAIRVSAFHAELLKHYRVVVFTDVDEFLVVDPLAKLGLREYLLRHSRLHANAIGLNVLQHWPTEGDYSRNRPLLEQRRYVRFSRDYCKQLVHTSRVNWMPGFHRTDKPYALLPGLYLLHTRAFDKTIAIRRISNRNRLPWSDQSLRAHHGWQNRLEAEEYLEKIHGTTAREFELALPHSQFNRTVLDIVQTTTAAPEEFQGPVRALEERVLSLPPRFQPIIPAVSETFEAISRVARPSALPNGQELFDRAMDAARQYIAAYEEVND